MTHTSYVSVTDQFCGAGGSSLGAQAAGAEISLALNHWRLAVETHNTNFPDTAHDCVDLSATEPRRYPATTILLTSPECTNQTGANGKKRPPVQLNMVQPYVPDPAAERSRATMWDVVRFAEEHDYRIIIVENVVEARAWKMWDSWWHAMTVSLPYTGQVVFLNSMVAHPTPQSRDRMYVVFSHAGQRPPDLTITPPAWCAQCGRDVAAVQCWKNPLRPIGKYRRQYIYACPTCTSAVEPYYYAAANAIDWTLPAPRIGERSHPLKPKTLERIRLGLAKFGTAAPLIVKCNQDRPDRTLRTVLDPFPTQCASGVPALTMSPLLIPLDQSDRSRPVSAPGPTQTTAQATGVLLPPAFLVETKYSHATNDRSRTLNRAWPAQTAQASQALVTLPFMVEYHGTSDSRAVTDALSTVEAGGNHHALLSPPPFLINYNGNGRAHPIWEALGTQPTLDHHALVTPHTIPDVDSCGFRVLKSHEVQRAMAFPDEYVVKGTQRERVRQLGNAVTPPVMQMLVARCLASLDGAA